MKLSTVLVLAVYATHHFFTEAHDTSPKQNFLQDHLRKRRELLKSNIRSAAVQTHGDQRRLDTSWTLWGETINGSIQGGQFGYSVAISASGKVFAAGAPYATISSTGALTSLSSASGESLPIQNNGQVQVYQYINGQWTKAGTVDGTAGVEENLGTSVALSWDGTKLAVGVPEAQNAGLVRMYQYNSARNWVRMGQDLKGPDAASNARVGAAVAMSSDGEIVGIGAPDAYSNRGLVRVYRYSTSDSNWTRMGQDLEGETNGDKNGFALDLSADGHTIAIGSPDRKVGTRVRAGRVRVYRFSDRDGTWSQIGQNIVGPTSGDELGYDVSLSADGRRVAIGLPGRNGNSGVADVGGVKVYEYNSSQNQWTQVGDDIVGKQKDAMLGASLSLSAAGDDLSVLEVIGKEVRHYSFVDDTWRQVGNAIKDDIEPDRVALSADGNKVG